MTPEEQNHMAASLAAHENIIAILLTDQLEKLSMEERDQLMVTMQNSPDHGIIPKGLELDIGTADELAGLGLLYRDAVNRVYALALAKLAEQGR